MNKVNWITENALLEYYAGVTADGKVHSNISGSDVYWSYRKGKVALTHVTGLTRSKASCICLKYAEGHGLIVPLDIFLSEEAQARYKDYLYTVKKLNSNK